MAPAEANAHTHKAAMTVAFRGAEKTEGEEIDRQRENQKEHWLGDNASVLLEHEPALFG